MYVVVKPIFDREGLNLIQSYLLHYFAYVISEKMYKKHFGKMKDEDSGDCDDDQDDDDDDAHGKKVDKTLTVHVELGKTSLNFRSRS